MALDRCERIRLLELAVESGAEPWEVINHAQEMENYVLGKPSALGKTEDGTPWHELVPEGKGN